MKPRLRHRICARPGTIAALAGAAVAIPVFLHALASEVSHPAILASTDHLPLLLLTLIPVALLGMVAGAIFLSLPLLILARKVNGAPFGIGEGVLILTGRHKGSPATVTTISTGQGGLPVLRLTSDSGESIDDYFEDHSVLRLPHETAEIKAPPA